MSRIGKLPINIPEGVTVNVNSDNLVTVKGKLGELTQQVNKDIEIKIQDNIINVINNNKELKQANAMHGLYRSLVNNMIIGVSEGFETKQEFVGVGYKAEMRGQELVMSLGYSHEIIFLLPPEIHAEAKAEKRANSILTMRSHDKQLIGMVASKIRSLRKPEPYKGKGIRFVGEEIRRKAGKSAAK